MNGSELYYLEAGAARYTGPAGDYVRFTMSHQLMNAETWKNFVRVFRADSDDTDKGWRCEYWGKMMRGACLTYLYNKDEALYAVLEETVRDLLTAQRADGRFSTYSEAEQLQGWDMWGRKYVLTAMLHFYRICRNQGLKEEILTALCRHADAILAAVGEGEDKVEITHTSKFWGGVNSCSILDAMVDLYRVTEKEEYLKFAQYILRTGGCRDGNLIELALENRLMPYQYPEVKAYETISFFEGVLSYYEVTGEPRCLQAVLNFVEAVNETDITLIGCSGCTHELFDHSAVVQTRESEGIMQETCVTVTWMRMMARLLLLTGEEKYFARMERSAWNALYGSVNTHEWKQYSFEEKAYVEPLPFDSYSPLTNNSRGRGIGGFKRFRFGGYYGCCACIAAAGIAIFPLCAALQSRRGLVINALLPGTVTANTPAGHRFTLEAESGYPAVMDWKAIIRLEAPEEFELKIRVPDYCENPRIFVNNQEVALAGDGWCIISCIWKDGDTVAFRAELSLKQVTLEDKVAFTYGTLVLARDAAKEQGSAKMDEPLSLVQPLRYRLVPVSGKDEEWLRLELEQTDGRAPLLLTNYASCGKNWLSPRNRITVWMPEK